MKLINDDCLVALKEISDESIDLVVTDCPYHIVGGGCSKGVYGNPGGILSKEYRTDKKGHRYYNDSKHISLSGILNDADASTYTRQGKLFKFNDIKFSEWLPEVYRVLKQGTHCYIYINARNLKDLWVEAEKVGFEYQQLIVWDKGNATPNRYYLNAFELILLFRKGKARNINNMGTKNILKIPNIIGNKVHPTEKPVELNEILILNSSDEGGVVLDPFMGSGSSGVACKRNNRSFIGVEIDEKYFKIASQRINGTEDEVKVIEQMELDI